MNRRGHVDECPCVACRGDRARELELARAVELAREREREQLAELERAVAEAERVEPYLVALRFVVRAFVLVALIGGAMYFAAWVTALDLAYYGGNP